MSQVSPIQETPIPQRVARGSGVSGPSAASGSAEAGQDQVEISAVARALSETTDIRADKVAGIRAAIQRGDYLSDDKIERTIDRLLEEIGR